MSHSVDFVLSCSIYGLPFPVQTRKLFLVVP